jgi:galactose mutarotase-like enzyme
MAQLLHQARDPHDHPARDAMRSRQAERLTLASDRLTVGVKRVGAELCSLRDTAGREFLWQAGPAWPRHAPILFPIVGRLHSDAFTAGGQRYPLGQHGFARDLVFDVIEQGPGACRLLLTDGPATWEAYPFPFRLEVAYTVTRSTVTVTFTVTNPGEGLLPFSIGAHPAFAWPLPGARARQGHSLTFEQDEPAPCYRPGAGGLLDPTPQALPTNGRALGLREEMFADGAFILLSPASRHVRFAAPGAPAVEVAWQGMDQLGIWTKPGGGFLCIEPWAGHADIAGYETEIWWKPGIRLLHPGESRSFLHRITIDG